MAGARAQLEQATQLLERVVAGFEPERLDADAALAYLTLFARLGKVAEAGQALAARRVDACGAYRRERSSVGRAPGGGDGGGRDRPGEYGGRGRQAPARPAVRRRRVPPRASCRSTRRRRLPKRRKSRPRRKPASWSSRHARRSGTCASGPGRFVSRPSATAKSGTSGSGRCGPSATGSTVTGWCSGHFRFPPDSGAAFVNRVEEASRPLLPRRRLRPSPSRTARPLRRRRAGRSRHRRGRPFGTRRRGRGPRQPRRAAARFGRRRRAVHGRRCRRRSGRRRPTGARRCVPQGCPRRWDRGPAGPALRAPRVGGGADGPAGAGGTGRRPCAMHRRRAATGGPASNGTTSNPTPGAGPPRSRTSNPSAGTTTARRPPAAWA